MIRDNLAIKGQRFVSFDQRKQASIISHFKTFQLEYVQTMKYTKWNYAKWKNLTLMKDPMSLSIYLNLLQELQPKTILEFGTYEGGSALWMYDMLVSLSVECTIHTFDINQDNVKLPKHLPIHFHQLDVHQIASFITSSSIFQQLKHPVLVIEDAHTNILELLNCVDTYLLKGDYLIVEDTLENSKYKLLETFLQDKCYLVDQYYCDFWGYNNSWNINSILRKD